MVAYFHLTRFDNAGVSSPILQGASFQLVFYYFADISTYTPRGQIRSDYAVNNGSLLGSFTFDPLVYEEVVKEDETTDMATIIIARLSPEITELLPVPNLRNSISDRIVVGANVWVYDIELESETGEVIRLSQGFVEVMPEVTR
jgi:hypothetical protein